MTFFLGQNCAAKSCAQPMGAACIPNTSHWWARAPHADDWVGPTSHVVQQELVFLYNDLVSSPNKTDAVPSR